jgi:3-oxoacyl-[acyl-carrier protein] reductase
MSGGPRNIPTDLAGASVLVTGASSGIGAALAVGFGSCGAKVAIHYRGNAPGARETARLADAAGAASILVLQADLLDSTAPQLLVDRVVQAFGGLDVLVNNAGDLLERRPLQDIDDPYLQEVLQLNFCSVVHASRAAMPHLLRSGGSIVNVTSVAARTGGGGDSSIYAAAKAAVASFTRSLAKDHAGEGVRANALSPGTVATPFHDRNTTPESMVARASEVPMGRVGVPEDCVGAALFLASNAASGYVTGQSIEVNGGRYLT